MIKSSRKGGARSKVKRLFLLFPAPVSYTRAIVDTPTDTPVKPLANAYVEDVTPQQTAQTQTTATQPFGPDNPPWGVGAALLVWIASALLVAFVPAFAGLAYAITRINRVPADKLTESLLSDPTFLLISVAAIIPAHLLTFWLVWWLVTANGRRSFRDITGLSWSRRLGALEFVVCAGVVVFLLVMSGIITHYLPGGETDVDKIVSSSAAARYTVVLLAVFSAPLVEEAVYRGTLYPALARSLGKWRGLLIVAALFALVHAWQYRANVGVIMAITLLSLTLTLVRAQTGRLLPCIVVHCLFNGVSSLSILRHSFAPTPPDAPTGLLLATVARLLGLNF